jgi:hypothetical protein
MLKLAVEIKNTPSNESKRVREGRKEEKIRQS